MPTEIYIDVLFFINFVIDYFLLLGTAAFMRYPAKRTRLAISAAVGALYAVLVFFPFFSWGICFLMKGFVSIVMVFAAFGYKEKKQFAKLILCFYVSSFLFGGTVQGLYYFTGIGTATGLKISNGAFYLNLPVWLLLGYILFCYGLLLLANKITAKRGAVDERLYNVEIVLGLKSVEITAMVDSGNLLKSITGKKSVMIVGQKELLPLFDGKLPPVLLGKFDQETGPDLAGRVTLIPFCSLGTASGILPAFSPDRIVVKRENHRQEVFDVLVGVSPTRLSTDGQFQGLLNSDMTIKIKEAV